MNKKKTPYKPGPWSAETVAIMGDGRNDVGWTVKEGDDVIVDLLEGGGWTKKQLRMQAHLIGAAPQMKADIDAFIAAMEGCDSRDEAVKIAKDFYQLFLNSQAKAEGKKK